MDNELKHFGVPGMKWGVRKGQYRSLNRKQRNGRKTYVSDRILSNRAIVNVVDKPATDSEKRLNFILDKRKKSLEKVLNSHLGDADIVSRVLAGANIFAQAQTSGSIMYKI